MEPPPPLARRLSHPLALLCTLPASALAAVQIAWAWPFFSDDSFISLRFAERLLSGQGLTWTDGEAVEGYSNLLWVLLCAGLGALGIDLVAAARLLGIVCTASAFWLLAAAARPRNAATALLATLAPLLLAGTTQIMGWTTGGLEGPLALLLLVLGLLAVLDLRERYDSPRDWPLGRLIGCGLPFALLVWTRPDGPLWATTTGIALALAAAPLGVVSAVGRAIAFGLLPMLALLAQLGFRWLYYGDWVPNTAHVKVDLGAAALDAGADYVGAALATVLGLTAAAAGAAAWLSMHRLGRRAVLVLLLSASCWLGYLALVGGDHFPGYRLFHPVLAPLGLLVAWSARHLRPGRRTVLLAATVAGIGTAGNVALSRTEPLSAHLRTEQWEWQGKVIGEVLGTAFGESEPLLAVDAAGAVPFYSRLPALDMLGLCDRTIARTATPAWAAAAASAGGLLRSQGHLRGNGDYVMARAPDLIQFNPPPGMPLPVFVSGLEFEGDPRFLTGYRLLVVEIASRDWAHGLHGPITTFVWIRVEGRIGVRSSPRTLEIPGYLFGGYRLARPIMCRHEPATDPAEATARRDATVAIATWITAGRAGAVVPAADGRLELVVRKSEPLVLDLAVPAGNWQVGIEPAGSGFVGEVTDSRVTLRPTSTTRLPTVIRQVTLSR